MFEAKFKARELSESLRLEWVLIFCQEKTSNLTKNQGGHNFLTSGPILEQKPHEKSKKLLLS